MDQKPPEQPTAVPEGVESAPPSLAEPVDAGLLSNPAEFNTPNVAAAASASQRQDVAGSSIGVISGEGDHVEVFGPAATPSDTTPSDLDSAFFEPTLSDVQAHHASVLARSSRLNEAPLLTGKFREADRAEKDKKKAEKWPTTTIRVKFSDGTMIQRSFPSSSPIQPVYEFVRTSLDPSASMKPFTLWQPPRYHYPEHPVPSTTKSYPHKAPIVIPASYGNVKGGPTQGLQGGTGGKETLSQLGLVPQSVLLIKWNDEGMNASGVQAPLRADLLDKIVPLPPPQAKEAPAAASASDPKGKAPASGEKKIPKWLQKGLLKRK